RLMPELSNRYCGICWYFSNSAAQAAADSGGRMPLTGCHSVIDRPDSVSLVMPPITTIRKIRPQHTSSQTATARRPGSAKAASLAAECEIAVGRDTPVVRQFRAIWRADDSSAARRQGRQPEL